MNSPTPCSLMRLNMSISLTIFTPEIDKTAEKETKPSKEEMINLSKTGI